MFAAMLVCCAALLCACVLLWLQGRRARSLTRHLPGFPPLPLLGNVHQIMGDSHYLFKIICKMSKIMDDANAPFVGWIGPQPFIMVSKPEDVKAVTNAFIGKPYYYGFAQDYVGNGLVTAPGEIWKRNIKKLGGTFAGSIVEGYQGVFDAQAQRLVQKLRGEVGKEPFDAMKKYLAITTLESICQTALGIPRISDSIVTTEYYTAFVRVFELLVKRIRNLFMHMDFIYRLSADYRELMKYVAVLHNASHTIMTTRRREREALKAKSVNHSLDEKTRFKSFLDILLELQDVDPSLTDEQIRSEVDTIIVGGQETVATTMFMSLLMMGCKPDIQEKLHAEIKEIFGDSRRPVEKEDLTRMKYCDAVVNETLRMFPPIPLVARLADRDLQLKSCLIPKGTVCGINMYGSGRSRHIWGPDADEYRPERWLSEDSSSSMSSNLLAFSYGKRSCIGKRYAIPIIKTILTHCVREFKFKSEAENLQLRLDVGLKAQSGHLMTLTLRE